MPIASTPIATHLVPDAPARAREGFVRVAEPLDRGVPHAIEVAVDVTFVVVVPTGVATLWLEAEPTEVVSSSEPETVPPPPVPLDALAAAPVRLLVARAGSVVASLPLVAGALRLVPARPGPDAGVALAVEVVSWRLCAGTLCGPGRYGSQVELGWRRMVPAPEAPVA
ncbi:MAG TPA: hypothetical protein VF520_13410 [Thermoleophilaceae bacterium]|jgi:hypothetical protein